MGSRVGVASKIQQGIDFDLSQPETLQKFPPIIRALKSQKSGNSIEILAEYSGLKFNKEFNYVLDNNTPIPIDHLLSRYGFVSRLFACPDCLQSVDVLALFQHLQFGFQSGHKYTHAQVIKWFEGDIDGTNRETIDKKNRVFELV